MRLRTPAAVAALLTALVGLAAPPAPAVQTAQAAIVSADPVDGTPHVVDGEVKALATSGSTLVVGGLFTGVRNEGTSTALPQANLFAVDLATMRVRTAFDPALNGEVTSLAMSPDGASVYVGGAFTTLDGVAVRKVVRLSLADGSQVAGFRAPPTNGRVEDIKLVGNRLYVAGSWTTIGAAARPALATINPATGAVTNDLALAVAAPVRGGNLVVKKIDVTPDGRRLVALGNFSTVGGQPRNQLAVVDTTVAGGALTPFQTDAYAPDCKLVFPMYVRDVDISPDGTYFVVVTTGAYYAAPKLCDTAARWELDAVGPGVRPTWVSYTGGDTLHSVAVSGTAVYVGGHQRWANNPLGSNVAGPGAVPRDGIAALDPANGLPYSWNPGRTRGVGVFDMLATADGLWVGSDTDSLGGEWHQRLAFLPLRGGAAVPPAVGADLPGEVHLLGPTTGNRRSCDAALACTTSTADAGGVAWDSARGAFWLSGTLYTGWADGTLRKRAYDGTTAGPEQVVDLHGLTAFATELQTTTGMYVAGGTLYYTLPATGSRLYARAFTAESDVVGATRQDAVATNLPGLAWSAVRGMFRSGSTLYAADAAGSLYAAPLVDGVPRGSWTRVAGATGWASRGAVVLPPAAPPAPAPVASFPAPSCTGLTCAFDGSGSTPDDASLRWDFGDGATGTGAQVSHAYAAAGTYAVRLTATDATGRTSTATHDVVVTAPTTAPPTLRAAAATTGVSTTRQSVQVPAAVRAGDVLLLWSTANNDAAATPSGTGWTLVRQVASGTALTSRLWTRTATDADAGTTVVVALSKYAKADATLLAYAGADAAAPVAALATAVETADTAVHTSPAVSGAPADGRLATYWADKSALTEGWTLEAGLLEATEAIGTGSGRITSASGDSAVTGTAAGGLRATTTPAATKAVAWTVVLAPAR